MLANRVKPHTDFRGIHESGVLKMLVIGLGKREGASQVHKLGLRGVQEVLPSVGRFLVENTRFALGLAIVENADDVPAEIVALEPETIFDLEPKLLDRARGLMGRLPFDQIDVLVVGELGKNTRAPGMDPNVIGRLMIETQPDLERPGGHATGGARRLGGEPRQHRRHRLRRPDHRAPGVQDGPGPFRINTLTSCFLERSPDSHHPADRPRRAPGRTRTCWRIDPCEARIVIIPNTLELNTLWVSPPLDDEVRAHPHLTRETEFLPMPIGNDGWLDLVRLFPESVRADARGRGNARAGERLAVASAARSALVGLGVEAGRAGLEG